MTIVADLSNESRPWHFHDDHRPNAIAVSRTTIVKGDAAVANSNKLRNSETFWGHCVAQFECRLSPSKPTEKRTNDFLSRGVTNGIFCTSTRTRCLYLSIRYNDSGWSVAAFWGSLGHGRNSETVIHRKYLVIWLCIPKTCDFSLKKVNAMLNKKRGKKWKRSEFRNMVSSTFRNVRDNRKKSAVFEIIAAFNASENSRLRNNSTMAARGSCVLMESSASRLAVFRVFHD